MLKAILMDIDGTLVDHSGVITEETKKTLLKAQEKGMKLILASGRPINGMVKLAQDLEMDKNHGICVCFNGSRVVDVQTGEVLFNKAMSVEEGKEVLHHMKNFKVRPVIVKDEYSYVLDVFDSQVHMNGLEFNILKHETHDNGFMLCEVKDLEEFVDYPLNKILNIGEPEYLQEHWQEMAKPFEGRLNSMFTAPFYYEFTAQGVDKVKALKAVLEPMGIAAEECIAFGDAQNDATMIEFAGIGVAMGNAVESLKEKADFITKPCGEDGIAFALKKYVEELN